MPLPVMAPPPLQACVVRAEQKYQVPACILRAIHQIESGGSHRPGLMRSNTNGTRDYGVTQINTVWMRYFNQKFGITAHQITSNSCLAIHAAAYVVRFEINASGDFWMGVGRYHSRTPARRDRYLRRAAALAQQFGCTLR
ncbi:Putative Lytic transglycosylase, catalytic (fragment) [Candidatus Glomeribacter gigasporarum BEG34]|uniref:Putative Lytic transglycosylase, catalytic n=2 Tax=Candidatus Glomeribacter gigasporarum TaxID=132144 RepID=G2JBU0_9BURK